MQDRSSPQPLRTLATGRGRHAAAPHAGLPVDGSPPSAAVHAAEAAEVMLPLLPALVSMHGSMLASSSSGSRPLDASPRRLAAIVPHGRGGRRYELQAAMVRLCVCHAWLRGHPAPRRAPLHRLHAMRARPDSADGCSTDAPQHGTAAVALAGSTAGSQCTR